MKTMKISFKATAVIIAGVFALLFNNVAVAGIGDKNNSNLVELKYAGKYNLQPKFRLLINDNSATEYVVTIKEGSDVLFTEKVSGLLNRTYQLDSDDTERIQGTTFEVTNKATNVTNVYSIKSLTQTVENMVVSKL